jgi:hypothetical protein
MLEAAGKAQRRHGDGCCYCRRWIAREQEGEEMPSARKPIAKGSGDEGALRCLLKARTKK